MKIGYIILLLTCCIFSQTNLFGKIEGKTFKPTGNPYFVSESVVISGKKPTIIKPGCIFLFKIFTELDIRGPLIVSGSVDSPIIFTSIHDDYYNEKSDVFPNVFDWNGIKIQNNAEGVIFKKFTLMYSTFGIKSQTEYIDIEHGQFKDNGQYHFTIKGKIEPVFDGISYNYHKKIINDNDSTTIKPSKLVKTAKTTAIITGAVVLGSSLGCYISANKSNSRYMNAESQNDINKCKSNRDFALKLTRTTGTLGTIFMVVGTGFILYEKGKKISKKFSFYTGEINGFCITLDF